MNISMLAGLREVAWSFPLAVVAPTVCLGVVGCLVRRLRGPHPAGLNGSTGSRLRRVCLSALLTGMLVGTLLFVPVPFEITVMLGAACMAVCAAQLTWSAKEPLSAAFCSVGALTTGIGLVHAAVYSYGLFTGHVTSGGEGDLLTSFLLLWPLCALPGLIFALIAAFLNINSAPVEPTSTQRAPAYF